MASDKLDLKDGDWVWVWLGNGWGKGTYRSDFELPQVNGSSWVAVDLVSVHGNMGVNRYPCYRKDVVRVSDDDDVD